MVWAILAGRKSETRRPLKYQPDDRGLRYCNPKTGWEDWHGKPIACPFGQPGDSLYVRETFFAFGWWEKVNGRWNFRDLTPMYHNSKYMYMDNPPVAISTKRTELSLGWYKRPSIHMPKEAARIWLKVTEVEIERVQEITEEGAIAEGIRPLEPLNASLWAGPHQFSFWRTFEEIYPGAWGRNDWVWVIKFEVAER